MARTAACTTCRQNKLRCNASSTFPAPCSRCGARNLACRIDLNYKRVPTRKLKSGLQIPSQPEQWPNQAASTGVATSTEVVSPRAETVPGSASITPLKSPQAGHDLAFKFDDLVLLKDDVDELFQEYFVHYHQQLPVLDAQTEPGTIIDASPLLFWTIVFTSCRNLPSQQRHFRSLCDKLPGLLGNLMTHRHDSVHTIQALLILNMWPPPVQRQSDDMRWVYNGMAMQMAMQAGCHRVGYEHEYHSFTYSKSVSDERNHTRIWRCWCFVNALLSCELGLPCLVPFDALELKPNDEAALPADFISKLRIVLYVSRINDTLGDNTCKDGSHRMRMVRLLEKDLNSLVFGLRQSPVQWNSNVEFVYLSVLLNLYSFCLRWSSQISLNDPDHTIIQSSAANSACQLIKIYASSPPPGNNTSVPLSCSQRYYPKFYLRFHTIALLMLLKISALNQISLRELGEVDDAIRLGHGALMSCSSSEGDEFHRAASVVEVLCKKGVIDSVRGKSPVESRFGASLWLELVATAIRWRRQNSKRGPRPVDASYSTNDKNDNNHRDGIIPSSSTSKVVGPMDATMAASTGADIADAGRLTMADVQGNVNLFPFSIDDWSAYLDVTQADLGLGCDSSWWGGLGG